MITASINITGELARTVGELSSQHLGAGVEIVYDDARAEQFWAVTFEEGQTTRTRYIVNDETGGIMAIKTERLLSTQ